ncbi:MAG: methionine synthase [Bacteroidaceae bacterium]|nr:methionine synthase [Bacteroidaceae bacterium]
MLQLTDAVKERILILDGAMGTMIQKFALTEEDFRGERFATLPGLQKGNNDLLCLTRPDVIADIHRRYLSVGVDIIETCTFNAQRISMADYGCEHLCREINLAAVAIARREAQALTTPDKPRYVVGSIGPTNKTCSISPDVNDPAKRGVTYDELVDAYDEQIEALIEGGVDGLLIETIFDTLNAKAAIYAAEQVMARMGKRLPIMLSVTISDAAGRTLSGQTLDAFLASVSHADIFSVGLNCSFGAAQMKPYLKALAARAPYYISCYPNAGLPNSLGGYDQSPADMAVQVKEYVTEGLVNIIGGCCGTTDAYIAEYAALVEGAQPHVPAPRPEALWLSGLELCEVTPERNFINVGERCNVAGSRKFLRLINEKKYDEALSIARHQVEDGAQLLDINMDDGLLDTKQEMVHFLNLLASEPDIARVPIMVDSSDWEVITAAVKCIQGKCVVNSISLKEGEEPFLARAREIRRLGAAVVVMAFDEEGQADTYERRIAICERAYRLLVDVVGMSPQDIIFDPNILAVATGIEAHNTYAIDFIRATEWIRTHLPGAHVSGGVSNLSFAFRGNNYLREAMHAVFLYHAIKAGMDMGIVNPATSVRYDDIAPELLEAIEAVILASPNPSQGGVTNTERLIQLATEIKDECGKMKDESSHPDGNFQFSFFNFPLEDRLQSALIKGSSDTLEADLAEALTVYPSAVAIIEGPLMAGMQRVGQLFGEGRMFLPQVVKTARTMKQAVEILAPLTPPRRGETSEAESLPPLGEVRRGPQVLLATVKGDVHDIGKNIVSVVMGCNGYDIIDMGVMVPAEDIVQRALECRPDIIGLSGLITPSLAEMVDVAKALRSAGIRVPLLIGGATTSAMHTALKIAPAYDGPVVYVKDASQNSGVAAALLNPDTRDAFVAQLFEEQATLRQQFAAKEQAPLLSLDEARAKKPDFFS